MFTYVSEVLAASIIRAIAPETSVNFCQKTATFKTKTLW
jgi:hypothetical protein